MFLLFDRIIIYKEYKTIFYQKGASLSLDRFIAAQEKDYEEALNEIRRGRKKSHWIWYVFPQIRGLGHSLAAQKYAVRDLREAVDFINHPVLGPRLVEISRALLALKTNNVFDIFDFPDNLKLRSSMTLFFRAAPDIPVFKAVLDKFFAGDEDIETLKILKSDFAKSDR